MREQHERDNVKIRYRQELPADTLRNAHRVCREIIATLLLLFLKGFYFSTGFCTDVQTLRWLKDEWSRENRTESRHLQALPHRAATLCVAIIGVSCLGTRAFTAVAVPRNFFHQVFVLVTSRRPSEFCWCNRRESRNGKYSVISERFAETFCSYSLVEFIGLFINIHE